MKKSLFNDFIVLFQQNWLVLIIILIFGVWFGNFFLPFGIPFENSSIQQEMIIPPSYVFISTNSCSSFDVDKAFSYFANRYDCVKIGTSRGENVCSCKVF